MKDNQIDEHLNLFRRDNVKQSINYNWMHVAWWFIVFPFKNFYTIEKKVLEGLHETNNLQVIYHRTAYNDFL